MNMPGMIVTEDLVRDAAGNIDWSVWPYGLGARWPHFTPAEFRCGDEDEIILCTRKLDALEELRARACEAAGVDAPLRINRPSLGLMRRGYRTAAANALVRGSKNSQHMRGRADDVDCPVLTPKELALLAEGVPVYREGGIGVYDTFVHLDSRPDGPARWVG